MVAYNQFNWTGGYTGRKGASKIVILETDGVANQRINGTFRAISGGGGTLPVDEHLQRRHRPEPDERPPGRHEPGHHPGLADLPERDRVRKPWPTFPAYTNGAAVCDGRRPGQVDRADRRTGRASRRPAAGPDPHPGLRRVVRRLDHVQPEDRGPWSFSGTSRSPADAARRGHRSIESYKIIGTSTSGSPRSRRRWSESCRRASRWP